MDDVDDNNNITLIIIMNKKHYEVHFVNFITNYLFSFLHTLKGYLTLHTFSKDVVCADVLTLTSNLMIDVILTSSAS